MAINTSFYTMPQEDFPNRYGMKRFTKTYKNLILDGDLPINQEWDKTISPWAMSPRMGENAHYQNDLINRCWLYPDINTMKGISESQPFEDEYITKTTIAIQPQHEFPFIVMCGDGGQGVALPSPDWKGRISPDQETTDTNFGNVKTNFYMLTEFEYKRLVWLIRVYVSDYGYNSPNYSVSRWHYGSWYDLGDITDTMYADILSGNKSITGIKFVPYYAGAESQPNERRIISSTGFLSLADTQPLDGSASGLGINAPYTTDYIDYSLTAFANYATSDYEDNSYTFSLGSTGGDVYHNNFRCKISTSEWFNSTVEWAEGRPSWGVDGNFTETKYHNGIGTDSTFWKMEGLGSSNWMYMYYRQRLDESLLNTKEKIRDYILTQAAYLGCWFVEKSNIAMTGEMSKNNTDAYIGVIESDGLTHGQYQKGSEINTSNADWVNPWDDSPYIPYVPDPDPNTYDDDNETIFNDVIIRPEFCTRYALTRTQLVHAHNFLCTQIAANVDSDYWSAQKLYVNNPMDVVQSVMLFPFDISRFQTDEPAYKELTFGQLVDSDYSVQLNREQYCVINMGECVYYPTFGNSIDDFRNYPPYSSATLYIPYCGSVEIDPNLYMGHTIGVKIIVDMGTGSCLALILRDKLVVDSISGTMGITIPITGIQTQTLAAAERQAESQLKTARNSAIKQFAKGAATIIAAPVSGGVVGVAGMAAYQTTVGDIAQAKDTITKAQFNLEHINVPYKTIGTATSTTSFANERKCRLIVRRPVMMNFDSVRYAHNTGYACLKTGNVSDFTGYTEFQTVDLSGVNATSTEKEMIFKLMQGGVFN